MLPHQGFNSVSRKMWGTYPTPVNAYNTDIHAHVCMTETRLQTMGGNNLFQIALINTLLLHIWEAAVLFDADFGCNTADTKDKNAKSPCYSDSVLMFTPSLKRIGVLSFGNDFW